MSDYLKKALDFMSGKDIDDTYNRAIFAAKAKDDEITRLRAELAAEREAMVAVINASYSVREERDAWQASWSSLKKELLTERQKTAALIRRDPNDDRLDAALAALKVARVAMKGLAEAYVDVGLSAGMGSAEIADELGVVNTYAALVQIDAVLGGGDGGG